MPPLICGSPSILDQSFPRDENQLLAVADTLGQIANQLEENEIHLVLTRELAQFVLQFDWINRGHNYPLLIEIYNLLNQWFLQPNERLIQPDLSDITDYEIHPIPEGCSSAGLVNTWANEVGKLLWLHDQCCPSSSYFIGIACEKAYTGSPPQKYKYVEFQRRFPLVGPNEIPQLLIDAYVWEVESDIHRKKISFNRAYNNCRVIGAIGVEPPSSGSHYNIKFRKARSWPLDKNKDPIPDRFIKELVSITGYPLPVIKTALYTGTLPRKKLLLKMAI